MESTYGAGGGQSEQEDKQDPQGNYESKQNSNFSAMQQKAFDAFLQKESIFLTGPGGTGKTEVIRYIIDECTSKKRRVAVVAPTGIAAVHIGGRTIHSFMRFVPDDQHLTAEEVAVRIQMDKKNKYVINSYKKYDVLIIDEISMVDADLFEKMNYCLQLFRNNGRPFGGLQVIASGDFYQLPPVKSTKFVFESPTFYQVFSQKIELTEIFRQEDFSFSSLLNRIRKGILFESDIETLQSRVGANVCINGISPTKLYARNCDVDTINETELNKLQREAVNFVSKIMLDHLPGSECSTTDISYFKQSIVDGCVNDTVFKIGAQVLLTHNLDTSNGLCNGSRGVIIGFQKPTTTADILSIHSEKHTFYPGIALPVVQFRNCQAMIPMVKYRKTDPLKKIVGYIWTVPLKLAWATTIHRSQGLSLDIVEMTLDKSVFENGQAYVGLSRVRSLEGLSLSAFDPNSIRVNTKVSSFYAMPWSLLQKKYCV